MGDNTVDDATLIDGLLQSFPLLVPEMVLGLAACVLFVGATLEYVIEQSDATSSINSFGEALWFSVVTMTTVGYNNVTPRTIAGRIVGVLIILDGMILLSLITATWTVSIRA